MMLSKEIGIAALFAVGLGAPAGAAPLSPAGAAPLAGATVETVAYGCGRGFAPNGYGYCRPIYRGYGYRPYGYGYGYGYGPGYYGRPGVSVGLPGARLSFY